MKWPQTLYVHEGLNCGPDEVHTYDAYDNLDGVEEDNPIGIYRLHKVVRVKIKTEVQLIDEEERTKKERKGNHKQ